MSKILICGAIDNFDNPFSWQGDLKDDEPFSRHEFVNPYEIGEDVENPYENPGKIMEPVVDQVNNSVDGVLVSWEDDALLLGAVVYMREAHRRDIPVVIWYQGDRDTLQIPLSWMMNSYHRDRDTAIRVLLGLLGDNDALIDPV